ncbi:hypothetical protein DFH27DRAFT_598510 [Peziza echinospora]|nr:hypothetical protein DFH27DRAFT_598510 [Peziza echinospora]
MRSQSLSAASAMSIFQRAPLGVSLLLALSYFCSLVCAAPVLDESVYYGLLEKRKGGGGGGGGKGSFGKGKKGKTSKKSGMIVGIIFGSIIVLIALFFLFIYIQGSLIPKIKKRLAKNKESRAVKEPLASEHSL